MATKKKVEEKLSAKVVSIEMTVQEKNNAEIRKGRIEEYEVPVNEQDHVHVELEQVQLNSSFEKTSKPFIQKFDVRAWDNVRKNVIKLGFNHCKVLYAPEGVKTEIGDPKKDEKMKA